MEISIIPYNKDYRTFFYDLNIEWLESYFYVEPYDKEVLSNPEMYILNKSGHIFFALFKDQVVGTVALMPTTETGIFELTKMAVTPELRGYKIGQKLLLHCIDFAKNQGFKALMLYSNTKLENAIYLYRKYGFKELELESNNPYARANIKMQLSF